MSRALRLSLICGLALGLVECGIAPTDASGGDAEPNRDPGTSIRDAGTSPVRDAGSPARDAGTHSRDAGTPVRDAGSPASDAGSGSGSDAGENPPLARFSFFVTSMARMLELAKNDQGFGGDLRFGETGEGAGLRGADKICATIAEASMPGSSAKGWRAFLSTAGIDGPAVNAIDRIGSGPWYDRKGRLFANTVSELQNPRPLKADPAVKDDLPNEDGVPNHRPDPLTPAGDNHDTLTGSNAQGKLQSNTATCRDWTTSDGASANGKPQAGHSWPRGSGGGGALGQAMIQWLSAHDEPGCARQINLSEASPSAPGNGVGAGGGYGGIYCFALTP